MNPPGHFALAYLASRPRASALAPLLVGTFFPDVVDKSLMGLGVTPFGRTVGHSLFFWTTALLLWMIADARGLERARVLGLFVAGGLLHLGVDLADDVVEGFESMGYAFSAWFGWPYTNPDMWSWRVPHLWEPRPYATTSLELITLALTAFVILRDGRRRRAQ